MRYIRDFIWFEVWFKSSLRNQRKPRKQSVCGVCYFFTNHTKTPFDGKNDGIEFELRRKAYQKNFQKK